MLANDISFKSMSTNLTCSAGLLIWYHDHIRPLSDTASICERPAENWRIAIAGSLYWACDADEGYPGGKPRDCSRSIAVKTLPPSSTPTACKEPFAVNNDVDQPLVVSILYIKCVRKPYPHCMSAMTPRSRVSSISVGNAQCVLNLILTLPGLMIRGIPGLL